MIMMLMMMVTIIIMIIKIIGTFYIAYGIYSNDKTLRRFSKNGELAKYHH